MPTRSIGLFKRLPTLTGKRAIGSESVLRLQQISGGLRQGEQVLRPQQTHLEFAV